MSNYEWFSFNFSLLTFIAFFAANNEKRSFKTVFRTVLKDLGGEQGIRTLEWLMTITRFPIFLEPQGLQALVIKFIGADGRNRTGTVYSTAGF